MDLPMAGRMKQHEIVEPVGAAMSFPDDMMHVPSALGVDQLTAHWTSAGLSLPQHPQTADEYAAHEALLALLKVGFPFRVEGIRISFDLDVPSDSDGGQVLEHYPFRCTLALSLSLRREYPLGMTQLPVSLSDPVASLVRVTALCPLPQASPNLTLRRDKGCASHRAAMVVGPPTNQRVKPSYQRRLRRTNVLLYLCPDFG